MAEEYSDMASMAEPEAPPKDKPEGGKMVHIPKQMLPEGCKAGDTYEIKVAGEADEEGDVPVEIMGHSGESEKPWESDFREYMSPRHGEGGEEAM